MQMAVLHDILSHLLECSPPVLWNVVPHETGLLEPTNDESNHHATVDKLFSFANL